MPSIADALVLVGVIAGALLTFPTPSLSEDDTIDWNHEMMELVGVGLVCLSCLAAVRTGMKACM